MIQPYNGTGIHQDLSNYLVNELTNILLHEKQQVIEPHTWSGLIFEQQKRPMCNPIHFYIDRKSVDGYTEGDKG